MHLRLTATILLLTVSACGYDSGGIRTGMDPIDDGNRSTRPSDRNQSVSAETNSQDPDQQAIPGVIGLSEQSMVKMKKQKLLQADLAAALNLETSQLCKELATMDCITEVHHITLGGVDPYKKNIYKPKAKTAQTTPVIIERVVLSACQNRVDRDFFDNEGFLFTGSTLGNGQISEADMNAAVTKLVQNAYLRQPKAQELSAYRQMYAQLKTSGKSNQTWALMACYVTFTSVEFLFY